MQCITNHYADTIDDVASNAAMINEVSPNHLIIPYGFKNDLDDGDFKVRINEIGWLARK